MTPTTTTGEKLIKHVQEHREPAPAPAPREAKPFESPQFEASNMDAMLKEPLPVAAPRGRQAPRTGSPLDTQTREHADAPTIISALRESCERGEVGVLEARTGQLATLIERFAEVGVYARTGYLEASTTITLSRTLRDVIVSVTKPGIWQRAAERVSPEFGQATVSEATVLKALDGLIDRNTALGLPTLVVLDASMCIEDHDALAALAARRKVGIAHAIESNHGPVQPEWHPNGR
jgi:hypothetical protein